MLLKFYLEVSWSKDYVLQFNWPIFNLFNWTQFILSGQTDPNEIRPNS